MRFGERPAARTLLASSNRRCGGRLEVNSERVAKIAVTSAKRLPMSRPIRSSCVSVSPAGGVSRWAESGPNGLVFPAPRGGPMRHSNFYRGVWLRAPRTGGVEGLRSHAPRRTAATLALAAGANTRELMERMGHASPAAALRYQHSMAGRGPPIPAAPPHLLQAL